MRFKSICVKTFFVTIHFTKYFILHFRRILVLCQIQGKTNCNIPTNKDFTASRRSRWGKKVPEWELWSSLGSKSFDVGAWKLTGICAMAIHRSSLSFFYISQKRKELLGEEQVFFFDRSQGGIHLRTMCGANTFLWQGLVTEKWQHCKHHN